eukprot:gene33365-41175_t
MCLRYIHNATPSWNGIKPEPQPGQDTDYTHFTAQMRRPKAYIAVHARYRYSSYDIKDNDLPDISTKSRNKNPINDFLRRGFCYSPPFPHKETACVGIDPASFYIEMHRFEHAVDDASIVSPAALKEEDEKRFKRIHLCSHEWDKNEMQVLGLRSR